MIKERIQQLRKIMQQKGLHAFYINGSDPHMSEYLPDRWQTRSFISGFTGSYGWVAITMNDAALWTDSRYWLQAEEQLIGTGIQLMKARLPETQPVESWLCSKLTSGNKVGVNTTCVSSALFETMLGTFSENGIKLIDSGDLLDEIWTDRPPFPNNEVFKLDAKYAGKSRTEKLSEIRDSLAKNKIDWQVLTALDDIAWTFNLRGNDARFNPVFLSYALIGKEQAILFINQKKVPANIAKQLKKDGIELKAYNEIFAFLTDLPNRAAVTIDPSTANQAIRAAINTACTIEHDLTTTCLLKAIKNETEINNISEAMRKDGVALLETFHWLETSVGKEKITEYDVVEKLSECRAKQADSKGDSFYPIIGYKEHGAIVHIQVNKENALELEKDGILLVDSGGHYLQGTTDTTRTIALGEPTEQQKSDFTLALKGMIALTMAKFPAHTRGYHLDILARKALWEQGLNYGHGTGHGVGFFLNVHEGPMSIRMEFNEQTIKPGMVLSNEPAFYREGQYGIRTENMIVCVERETTEFGYFLGFDTLTLYPIDTRLLKMDLLNQQEIDWLNDYHETVFTELSPLVNGKQLDYLKEKTKKI